MTDQSDPKFWDDVYANQKSVAAGVAGDPAHVFDRYAAPLKILAAAEPQNLLDVGAGYAGLCRRALKELNLVEAHALDFSEAAARAARYAPYTVAPADRLPFADGWFDAVTCFQTLGYVAHPDRVVKELKRVASKVVVVTVGDGEACRNVFDEASLRALAWGFNVHKVGRTLVAHFDKVGLGAV